MKKITKIFISRFLILLFPIFFFSCQSVLNEIGLSSPEVPGTEDPAQQLAQIPSAYKYLGYMYDSAKGKAINDEVFSGAVYEQYPDEINKALNLKLRFPLQTGSASASDFLSIPWYESLPGDIEDYIVGLGSETVSEGLSDGLTKFLSSEEGQELIKQYLDDVQLRLQDIIDYGLNKTEEQFEDEISLALLEGGVIAGSQLVSALSGVSSGMGGLQVLSMIQNWFYYTELSGQLDEIQASLDEIKVKLNAIENQLEEIQQTLASIEHKIDFLLNTTVELAVDSKHSGVELAQDEIDAIYDHLMGLDRDSQKTYLVNKLKYFDDYQVMIHRAFRSAVVTQEYITGNADSIDGVKFTVPGLSIRHVEAGVTEYFNYNMLKPTYSIQTTVDNTFCGMTLEDLLLVKRLSLSRLSLAEKAFSGDELLTFRAAKAQLDLENMLIPVKAAVNNMVAVVEAQVSEISFPVLPDPVYSGRMVGNLVGYKVYGDYFTNKSFIYANEFLDGYGLFYEISGGSYQEFGTRGDFIDLVQATVREIIYTSNKDYQNTMIIAAAELADWEIQLRAHIEAGK
ncbi:MAG: hypothetical protein GY754_32515 [bacterium]|nr:hypothetical protein [bacterium]